MAEHCPEQSIQKNEVIFESKFGSSISCFSVSPLHPEKIAIGCDKLLVKDLNDDSHQHFRAADQCVSITYIEWHPEEPVIGFGTHSGKVGIFNLDAKPNTRYVKYFHSIHGSIIYSIAWGPCSKFSESSEKNENSSKFFLYSCGDGKIIIHDPYSASAVKLDAILGNTKKTSYTEICWKPDYSQFAVGVKNSYLVIYDGSSFNMLFRIFNEGDVWCTRWHPDSVLNSPRSSLHDWIAVGLNRNVIHIYDLGIEKAPDAEVAPLIYESVKDLSGHCHAIIKLDWSPHVEGRLASCSKDCTVQIWDVILGQKLVNFSHDCAVLAVKWVISDPDLVISGDNSGRFCGWRPSVQVQSEPNPKKMFGNRKPCYRKRAQQRKEPASETQQHVALPDKNPIQCVNGNTTVPSLTKKKEKEEKRVGKKKVGFNPMQTCMIIPHEDENPITNNNSKAQQKSKEAIEPGGSYGNGIIDILERAPVHQCIIGFVVEELLAWRKENPEECNRLLKLPFSEIPTDSLVSAFVGRIEDFWKLITTGPYCVLSGDIYCECVHRTIQRNLITSFPHHGTLQTNPFFVGLSMAVSKQYWVDFCYRSAPAWKKRLDREIKITSLLITNQLTLAFNGMKRDRYFLEAYSMAKFRTPEDEVLIKEIEQNMLNHFQQRNMHELTAFFHLLHGDILGAAKMLGRRPTIEASREVAYLCRNHGYLKEAKEFSLYGIIRGFWSKKWDVIKEMIAEQPEIKDLRWVVAIHKFLVNKLTVKNSITKYGVNEASLFKNEESLEKSALWKSYDIEGVDCLSYLLNSLRSDELLDFKSCEFRKMYSSFKSLVYGFLQKRATGYSEVIVHITFHLCDFFMHLHMKDSEKDFNNAFQSIGTVMRICFDSGNFTLLNKICFLCFPFDIIWNNNKETIEIELSRITDTSIKEAFEWMNLSMVSRGLVKKNIDICQFAKRFSKDALEKELLSISVVDVIFTYFAIHFVKLLSKKPKHICKFDCHYTGENVAFAVSENCNQDLSITKEGIEVAPQMMVLETRSSLETVTVEVSLQPAVANAPSFSKVLKEVPSLTTEPETSQISRSNEGTSQSTISTSAARTTPSGGAVHMTLEVTQLQAEVPEVQSQREEPKVESPTEEPKIESPAEEPKVESPAEKPKVESPAEEPKIESPAEEPKVESPAEEPKVESPAEEPKVESPAEEPKVESPAEEPEIESPAEEPEIESPAEEPEVESPAEEPEVESPAEEPEVESPAEEPEVESPVEEPEVESPAEEPEVESPAEKPEVESPAEEPEVKSPAEEPEVKSAAEEPEVKSAAEEPEVKSPAKEPDVQSQAEESEVSSQTSVPDGASPVEIPGEKTSPETNDLNVELRSDNLKHELESQTTLVSKTHEGKKLEICCLCRSEKSGNENQENCCLNYLKPFFAVMNIIIANICNDVFKINDYFENKQHPEDLDIWELLLHTEPDFNSTEPNSTVDEFIMLIDRLWDFWKLLEEKGQVDHIPNIGIVIHVLKESLEKIKKFCMCPCIKFKLQSFVDYILEF